MEECVKISVLGAGHGGRAMAAYLASIGHDVNVFNRTPENIHIIKQSGGIYLRYSPELEEDIFPEGIEHIKSEPKHEYLLTPKSDHLFEDDVKQVFGRLNIISSDMKEVVKDRDIILVTVPATGHKDMAELCAPFLKDGQIILLNPGRFFGAIEFYKTICDYYQERKRDIPDITVGEAQTFIYACRRIRPGSVRIFGVKIGVDVAAIPSFKTENIINALGDAYPQFTPTDNVLKTSLSNLGGVFHVPITILNATRIDRRENFEYYVDGVTEHTASIIEEVDKERLSIAKAMGVDVVSARWWLHLSYDSEGADLYEAVQNTLAYRGIESPQSVNHRYIWEDVPTSLVPLASLGKQLNIPTPMIDAFIHQATSLLKKDLNINFYERGRTMEKLGLTNMDISEIKNFVQHGFQE